MFGGMAQGLGFQRGVFALRTTFVPSFSALAPVVSSAGEAAD